MKPDELMARAAASGIDLITTFQQSVPDGQERRLANYEGSIPKQTRVYKQPEWTAQDAAHACFGMAEHLYAAFAYRYAGDTSQRKHLKKALMVRVSEISKRDQWKRIRQCANCEGEGIVFELVRDERTGRAKGKPGAWETKPGTCPICKSFGTLKGAECLRGVGQIFVVEQLVDLAIFEEWLTVHYVTGLLQLARDRLWAGLVGIDQADWERTVSRQYRMVQGIIDEWCGAAYGMMRRELKEDADVA